MRRDDLCAVSMGADEDSPSSSEALQAIVLAHGSLFLVFLLVFCCLRNMFKSLYNCRDSVEELNCELSKRKFSAFGWIAGVFKATDDELVEQCGLDALAFCRLLRLFLVIDALSVFAFLVSFLASARRACSMGPRH